MVITEEKVINYFDNFLNENSLEDKINDDIEYLHEIILFLMGQCDCNIFRKSLIAKSMLKELSIFIPLLSFLFELKQMGKEYFEIENLKEHYPELKGNNFKIDKDKIINLEKYLYYYVALEEFLKRIIDDDFYELVYERYIPKDLYEFGKSYYELKKLPKKIDLLQKILTNEQIENLNEDTLRIIDIVVNS